MGKIYNAVDEYYKINHQNEFIMCHYLNKNMPLFFVKCGIFFEIQCENQYNKNDIILIQISGDRKKKLICKIEYEYATTQKEWDYELPRTYWKALNLIARKDYGNNFSLFIKSSPTFNSLFAIDCRDNFIQKNFNHIEKLNHSLSFETDDDFYRIYWNDVEKYKYCDDKENKTLKNGEICIVEFNDWQPFYSFIWRRFIKNKIKL